MIKTFEYIFTDPKELNTIYELLNREINELQNIKLFFEQKESLNVFNSFEKFSQYDAFLKQLLAKRTLYINGVIDSPEIK